MFNIIKTRIKEGIKTKKINIEDIKKDNIVIFNEELKNKLLNKSKNKNFTNNISVRVIDSGSCNACLHEMSALTNPYYDMERFGFKFVAAPKHADVLMVVGCVTRNMYSALLKTYENIPYPKFVVAIGDCAMNGGVFKDSYATLGGIQDKLTVDILIKGCPPEPIDILAGLLLAFGKSAK